MTEANNSPYRRQFKRKHVLLPVIHAETPQQSLENARIAVGEGADGIMLINHRISAAELLRCYDRVHAAFPDFWKGLNFLGSLREVALCCLPRTAGGLWIDDGGIREEERHPDADAKQFAALRAARRFKGIYFGGVAFKGQAEVTDLKKVTRLALPHMDVITTSGVGTGFAPAVDKIRTMRSVAPSAVIALASGITTQNIGAYMPFADCFLVATGISDSHTQLNVLKTRMLRNRLL